MDGVPAPAARPSPLGMRRLFEGDRAGEAARYDPVDRGGGTVAGSLTFDKETGAVSGSVTAARRRTDAGVHETSISSSTIPRPAGSFANAVSTAALP